MIPLNRMQSLLLAAALSGSGGIAQAAVTLVVPGAANPYLAGMPDGTVTKQDTAPQQSPVEVLGLPLLGGQVLHFSAAGTTNHSGCEGGNPDASLCSLHDTAAANGISGIRAPITSLLGVFLDDTQPYTEAAPPDLDFSSTTFATLSPTLRQVFFIGDGLTGTGSGNPQNFNVPAGATRLFLGVMDGYGWNNNFGEFEVTVFAVPAPNALWLLGSGLAWIGTRRRG